MLKIKDLEHMEKVKAFAKSKDLLLQLEEKLLYLDQWSGRTKSECVLTPDISDPNSFHVVMHRIDTMTKHQTLAFVGSLYFEYERFKGEGLPFTNANLIPSTGWKLRTTDY